jgi:hypothetical protein
MTNQRAVLTAIALSSCFLLDSAFGQGALTPPGAPAPTMKSLDQVEPRTPISSLPFYITQSGSYYLTANLSAGSGVNGITVYGGVNNVTIDLNGFTLAGSATDSAYGIVAYSGNVNVRNGIITGWGADGIRASSTPGHVFKDLVLNGNGRGAGHGGGITGGDDTQIIGCSAISNSATGFYLGSRALVKDCNAAFNQNYGIVVNNQSVLEHCDASYNLFSGVSANSDDVMEHCVASGNGIYGLYTYLNNRLADCTADYNTNVGIFAQAGSSVSGCITVGNSGGGIAGYGDNLITHCVAAGNTSAGISLDGPGIDVNNCTVDDNTQDGILVVYPGCQITDNLLRSNNITGIGAGIRVSSAYNRIEANHISYGNGYAIFTYASATNNVIIRNTTAGKTNSVFSIVVGNDVGPLGRAASATSPWANIYN